MEPEPLLLIIILPFLAGIAAILLPSDSRAPATWLAGATMATCLALTLSLYPSVSRGTVRHQIEWIPSLGLDFTLRMDGFAWIFALLVSGIGFLVVVYTRYYISPEDPVRRFYLFPRIHARPRPAGSGRRRRVALNRPTPATRLLPCAWRLSSRFRGLPEKDASFPGAGPPTLDSARNPAPGQSTRFAVHSCGPWRRIDGA